MTYIDIKRYQEDIISSVETPIATAEDLAKRIRAGDRAAEDEFVARFYRRVLLMARVRLRDERTALRVAMLATVGVLRRLRDRDVASNEVLSAEVLCEARRVMRELPTGDENDTETIRGPLQAKAVPELVTREIDHVERVRQILDAARPVDRAILGMLLVEGMGTTEIAGRLGMRPERVGRRKSKAVERLRKAVQPMIRVAPLDGG